ncbi:MAG: hypothetical protein PHY85_10740 [Bacteroidales bacterium]|nr:hypothetical protein [Bacteroidales bacterium]
MKTSTGITLTDVRNEAFDTIRMLKEKKIDVKDAAVIKELLNSVIETAKTQVLFLNALPQHVKNSLSTDEAKAIAGTLVDRDAEMDITMHKIGESQRKNPLGK